MDGVVRPLAGRILALALLAASLPAAGAIIEDVPFITTPDNVTMAMLRLAGVGPRDYVIDLGSGDGRIVITAARHFGARGLGVEIVPDLVRRSRENAARAGVQDRAQFLEQDLFATDLARATVVTLYLLPEVNLQLRPRLLALRPGTRIVSHDWDMGEWEPDRSVTLPVPDKKVGLAKSSRAMLWTVPARLDGQWCGERALRGTTLTFAQAFQNARGIVLGAAASHEFDVRIEGTVARSAAGSTPSIALKLDGERLAVTQSQGALAHLRGGKFRRRGASSSCS